MGTSFIYPPTACPAWLVVCGTWVYIPLNCLSQLIPLPFLHRPRHSPASRPHGPKSRDSHPCTTSTVRIQPDISPPCPPRRSQFQEQPFPTGTLPQLESSSLRKESSSCPSTAPSMPSRGMYFYIGLFKDFCLKDVSNVWERGWDGIAALKGRKGRGRVFIQGST